MIKYLHLLFINPVQILLGYILTQEFWETPGIIIFQYMNYKKDNKKNWLWGQYQVNPGNLHQVYQWQPGEPTRIV